MHACRRPRGLTWKSIALRMSMSSYSLAVRWFSRSLSQVASLLYSTSIVPIQTTSISEARSWPLSRIQLWQPPCPHAPLAYHTPFPRARLPTAQLLSCVSCLVAQRQKPSLSLMQPASSPMRSSSSMPKLRSPTSPPKGSGSGTTGGGEEDMGGPASGASTRPAGMASTTDPLRVGGIEASGVVRFFGRRARGGGSPRSRGPWPARGPAPSAPRPCAAPGPLSPRAARARRPRAPCCTRP